MSLLRLAVLMFGRCRKSFSGLETAGDVRRFLVLVFIINTTVRIVNWGRGEIDI